MNNASEISYDLTLEEIFHEKPNNRVAHRCHTDCFSISNYFQKVKGFYTFKHVGHDKNPLEILLLKERYQQTENRIILHSEMILLFVLICFPFETELWQMLQILFQLKYCAQIVEKFVAPTLSSDITQSKDQWKKKWTNLFYEMAPNDLS